MAITISDIISAIQGATSDQLTQIKEMVAPETKASALLAGADSLAEESSRGNARAVNLIAAFREAVQGGKLDSVEPTWADVVKAFQGP